MWLLIAFIAVPMIEIALFIQVGGFIGLWWTLLIVLGTAITGAYLVRIQGRLALGQLQQSFGEMRDPTEPLAHGAMILFSGALLLTPGFFTDFIGFSLLVPSVQAMVFKSIFARMNVQSFSAGHPHQQQHDAHDDVIDAEFTELADDDAPRDTSGWTKN